MNLWKSLSVGVFAVCVGVSPVFAQGTAAQPAEPQAQPVPENNGERGAESPQAVFEKFFKAGKNSEWKAMFSCLTDESGGMLIVSFSAFPLMMLEMQAQFAEGDEKKEAEKARDEYLSLLKTHGLDIEKLQQQQAPPENDEDRDKFVKEALAGVTDRAGLFAGIMDFMSKQGNGNAFGADQEATLENVEVNGDSATGTVKTTRDGEVQEQPIEFKKVNGKWLIELPMN